MITVRVPEGEMQYRRDLVAEIRLAPTPLQEYEQARARLSDSDADGHYKLGLFCEVKGLAAKAEEEFRRAIKISPGHGLARKKLGYVQLQGKWTTEDEAMRSRGFVKMSGRWVEREVAAAMEEQQRALAQQKLLERVRAIEQTVLRGRGTTVRSGPETRGAGGAANVVPSAGDLQKALESQLQELMKTRSSVNQPADGQRLLDLQKRMMEDQNRLLNELRGGSGSQAR
jgi:tetratricopeptide (TPR) repeat protein